MTHEELDKCPECGTPVGLGETQCRNGHLRPTVFGDTCALDSEVKRLDIADSALGGKKYVENTLFECVRCNRLLETQVYHEKVIVPRYCAWCGKPLSTILGREIDGYRIDEILAKGGFGLIYLASNIAQPKMKAVVKFLRPQMAYIRPELVRIFVEEARLTEEIGQTCWNVVRVSNVREKPWPYFFMEYIRGTTLDDIIENLGAKKIPLDECKGYLRGIAKALAATHAHGRVHRDLKPLNIMVIKSQEITQPEERIKLLDFGLAMRIARASLRPTNISATGFSAVDEVNSPVQSAGTPEYMAPEAYDGINEYGGDIYSFGVTAYEILTGKRPWDDPPPDGERFIYWRDAHKKKPPRPVRELRAECPNWLGKVVMKCLEKSPQNRIKDAEPLLGELREPFAFWKKAAFVAALLVCMVSLSLPFFGFGKQVSMSVRNWKVGEREWPSPLTLWVRHEKDLPQLDVRPVLEGVRTIGGWKSSAESLLRCEVLPDSTVRLRFLDGPELGTAIGRAIDVEGKGDKVVFMGTITVSLDAANPVVKPLQLLVSNGKPGPVTGRPRVNPSRAKFLVSVEEENVDTVRLHLNDTALGHQAPLPPLSGTRSKDASEWAFKLSGLKHNTEYDAQAFAYDLAGNLGKSAPVVFLLDEKVDVSFPKEDWSYLAEGNAFYLFRIEEEVERITVRRVGSGESVSAQFFEAPSKSDASSAIEFLSWLRGKEPVAAKRLKPNSLYLLSIAPAGGAKEASLEVLIEDTAAPPNVASQKLEWGRPPELTENDIKEIRLTLDQEEAPISSRDATSLIRKVQRQGSPPEGEAQALPLEFELARPTRSSLLKELEIKVNRDRVQKAGCALKGLAEHRGVLDVDSVSFKAIELEPNAASHLTLSLFDALGGLLSVKLSIVSDTKPPEVLVRVKEPDPKYHRMKSLEEVEVRLKSDKRLSRVVAEIPGLGPVPGKLSDDQREYQFDLSSLNSEEGNHLLKVEAYDLASNQRSAEQKLFVNKGAPRVDLLKAKPEANKTYVLLSDELFLRIIDGNGLRDENANVSFALDDGKKAETVRFSAVSEGNDHVISLSGLPQECSGTLTVSIADALGLSTSTPFPFRFNRPKPSWREEVTWKGMVWLFVRGRRDFYISKHEISNKVFKDPLFFVNGEYVLPAMKKYKRPAFWGNEGQFPTYSREDGKVVGGDDFPIVGISPVVAEAFGRKVFGARLPTWEEWVSAGWKEGQSGNKYPWNDVREGEDHSNCFEVWKRPGSPFKEHHYAKMKIESGKEVNCPLVEVSFDPFDGLPAEARERLQYSDQLSHALHLIGNVGEMVVFEPGRYMIAGGDWQSNYGDISLKMDGKNPKEFISPNARTGFRLVIPTDEVSEENREFIDAARSIQKK